jgi:hypothetical protein
MNLELAAMMCDFFRCPNTGKVIDAMKGDDKVICGCGCSNPAAPREDTANGIAHHYRRFLKTATAAEFAAQRKG